MPFIDGKYVSLRKWHELQPKRVFRPEGDDDEPQPEPLYQKPTPMTPGQKAAQTRASNKQKAAAAAALAATGVGLNMPDGITLADGETVPPLAALAGAVSAHLNDADLIEGTGDDEEENA